MIAMVNKHIN